MSDEDYQNLTGLNRMDFEVLCQYASQTMRNTPTRIIRTSVGIFLLKMKSGLPNQIMATLLNISKSSLRRAIFSVRNALMTSFVPKHLGFNHISRQYVISDHTRPLAQFLFGDKGDPRAILDIDGTYIYIYKSDNFPFQRRTYSMHKGRPLVKPMVRCTTSGYFLSILGPYLADSKNNDAAILNYAIAKMWRRHGCGSRVSGLTSSSGGPMNKCPDALFSPESYPQKMQIHPGWYQK